MPTRNVVITQQQAEMIDSLVRSGRYQNASEVLREGLRLIAERDTSREARLNALREAVKLGFDQLDRGEFVDVPYDKLGEYIRQLGEQAAASIDAED